MPGAGVGMFDLDGCDRAGCEAARMLESSVDATVGVLGR